MEDTLCRISSLTGDEIVFSWITMGVETCCHHGVAGYHVVVCEVLDVGLGDDEYVSVYYRVQGDYGKTYSVVRQNLGRGSSVYDFAEDTRTIDCGFHLRSLVLTAAVTVHYYSEIFFEFTEAATAAVSFVVLYFFFFHCFSVLVLIDYYAQVDTVGIHTGAVFSCLLYEDLTVFVDSLGACFTLRGHFGFLASRTFFSISLNLASDRVWIHLGPQGPLVWVVLKHFS